MAPLLKRLFLDGTKWLPEQNESGARTDSVADDEKGDRWENSEGEEDREPRVETAFNALQVATLIQAAKPKPNTAIDNTIGRLKDQGYADKKVASKLQDEGYPNVSEKTVATRWRKIRTEREKREEERLDDELSDWHEGEDGKLANAIAAADEKFKKDMAKLEVQKWKNVSINLANIIKTKKYTAKACKERYDALNKGNALEPIEMDPDKEGRRLMRERRIHDNKAARKAAANAAAFAQQEKERSARGAKEWKLENHIRYVEHKQYRRALKEHDKKLQLERQRGKEAERAAKAEGQRRLKAELMEKKQAREDEDRIFRYLTGHDLVRKHCDRFTADDDSEIETDSHAEEDEEGVQHLSEDDEDAASAEDEHPTSTYKPKEKKVGTVSIPAQVTSKSLANPRSVMTTGELDILLFERGLPRRGPSESHPEVVARVAAEDDLLASATLNNLLGKHFVQHTGRFTVRVRRLQEADAAVSAAGRKGVKADDPSFKIEYQGCKGDFVYLLETE